MEFSTRLNGRFGGVIRTHLQPNRHRDWGAEIRVVEAIADGPTGEGILARTANKWMSCLPGLLVADTHEEEGL